MSLSHLLPRDSDVSASLLLVRWCPVASCGWRVAGSTPSPGFPAVAPVKLGNLQYCPVPGSLVLRCGTAGGEPSTGLNLRFGFGRALLRDLGKMPLFKCQVISHT